MWVNTYSFLCSKSVTFRPSFCHTVSVSYTDRHTHTISVRSHISNVARWRNCDGLPYACLFPISCLRVCLTSIHVGFSYVWTILSYASMSCRSFSNFMSCMMGVGVSISCRSYVPTSYVVSVSSFVGFLDFSRKPSASSSNIPLRPLSC